MSCNERKLFAWLSVRLYDLGFFFLCIFVAEIGITNVITSAKDVLFFPVFDSFLSFFLFTLFIIFV